MTNDELSTDQLIQAYLDRAEVALTAAQITLDNGLYDASANRAYYAVFYASNALLLTKGIVRKKHFGLLSAFRESFVKTGEIEIEYSDIYGDLMSQRMKSDYVITAETGRDEAEMVLSDARKFVVRIRAYIQDLEGKAS